MVNAKVPHSVRHTHPWCMLREEIKGRKRAVRNFGWYTEFVLQDLLTIFEICKMPARTIHDRNKVQKFFLNNRESEVEKRVRWCRWQFCVIRAVYTYVPSQWQGVLMMRQQVQNVLVLHLLATTAFVAFVIMYPNIPSDGVAVKPMMPHEVLRIPKSFNSQSSSDVGDDLRDLVHCLTAIRRCLARHDWRRINVILTREVQIFYGILRHNLRKLLKSLKCFRWLLNTYSTQHSKPIQTQNILRKQSPSTDR